MKLILIFFLIATIFCGLKDGIDWEEVKVPDFEPLTTAFYNQSINRPLFHFTPKFGWMNDPNGMWINSTGQDKIYHLYYQYNPKDTVWGMPLDWGHTTSTNLLEWEDLEPAFGPDDGKSGAYSGSMFIDDENVSGMFTNSKENPNKTNLIAAYTFNDPDWVESQYLYFSEDGQIFKRIDSFNPVVTHSDDKFKTQFRDPQVVKFKKSGRKGYLMSVAKSQEYKIAFYLSEDNLSKSTWMEQINLELEGFLGYQYECPNLAHLLNKDNKKEEEKESYWVLFISINPGSIQGGSSTWYLFGEFELSDEEDENKKKKFYFNPATKYPAPLDYGKDFYAMQIFYEYKEDEEVEKGSEVAYGIAWASNWQYTGSVPTDPWRSSMSLPRKISIGHFQSSPETAILYIKSEPFFLKDKLSKLNFSDFDPNKEKNMTLNINHKLESFKITEDPSKIQGSIYFEITITVLNTEEFENSNPGHLDFYFKGANDNSEYLRFGYEQKATAFYLDRSHSNVPWVFENPYFSDKISLNVMPYQVYEAEKTTNEKLKDSVQYYVKGFIDRNIIELFFNEGFQTSTNTFFFTGGNFINDVDIKADFGDKGFNVVMNIIQITEK